jgi:hypothetical protein
MTLRRTTLSQAVLLCATVLTGCASVNMEQVLSDTQAQTQTFSQGQLALIQTPEQQAAVMNRSTQLLQQPLSQNDAVQLSLLHSPAWQALLAQHWANSARTAQSGRLANPRFSIESMQTEDEVEFGRFLSFGLLDILTWPRRHQLANHALWRQQLQLSS